MFGRILIANRGEIARRVIRACRELGVETVAVYSRADADSLHVEEADQAICIGPAKSSESYLNMEAILQAAEQSEAKAVHPGYGFLAENDLFAERCRQHKLTFIGPSPRVIRMLGDKATARRLMRQAGLPIVPGSEGVIRDSDEALELARQIGFPVLLKATAGGGGKGMRICRAESELKSSFAQASMEADKAFGNAGLYLEKLIEQGRHIEFQFVADVFGNAAHLGERECSVQRNHQKLIEEAPSAVIDPATRRKMGARVAEAIARIGYVGVGTMEFLRDSDGNLFFMEVNTRLQVEHPVTEMITGVDLVKEQIRIAANEPLSIRQDEVCLQGHAIECRINAEDPFDGFRPSPGTVDVFVPPEHVDDPNCSVRVDTYLAPGKSIPVHYDSMVCKLIVAGPSREATRRGMLQALERFELSGVATTIPAHQKLLEDRGFVAGDYDTGLVAALIGS